MRVLRPKSVETGETYLSLQMTRPRRLLKKEKKRNEIRLVPLDKMSSLSWRRSFTLPPAFLIGFLSSFR